MIMADTQTQTLGFGKATITAVQSAEGLILEAKD